MKKVLGFYRTFFQTLNPKNYEGFAESTIKNSFNYYATLVFSAFIVMLIVMIPTLVQLPNMIEKNFDNVESFSIITNIKTTEPIKIPEQNPLLLINYNNKTPTDMANVIINNDVLYTGFLMQKFTKDFSSYKDVKQNVKPVSNILAFLLLLMLPTLLLIFFFYILIKFFIVVVIAAVLGIIIASVIKYKVTFKKMFNCSIYGVSLTILLDLIFFALGFSFYSVQYLPLFIYLISGITQSGEKIDKRMKGRYIEVKG